MLHPTFHENQVYVPGYALSQCYDNPHFNHAPHICAILHYNNAGLQAEVKLNLFVEVDVQWC